MIKRLQMRTPQSQNEQEFEVMEKCIVEAEWEEVKIMNPLS